MSDLFNQIEKLIKEHGREEIEAALDHFEPREYVPEFEPIKRLNKDAIKAMSSKFVGGVTRSEARFLVDIYYTIQKTRIMMNNRVKGLDRDAKKQGNEPEPHEYLTWVLGQLEIMEQNAKSFLSMYVSSHQMAWFFEQTYGIGPVLAAGLLAHIDIEKAKGAGAIFKFAGLAPGVKWEKGQLRPWNNQLKTICWKVGDSFRKFHKRDACYYGAFYKQRKEYEIERNDAGGNADAAKQKLEECKIGKTTEAYKHYSSGKLPPAHIDARAARYAVKLFLSHLFERWYEDAFGKPAPNPYPISILGHKDVITPPQINPVKMAA